MKRETRSKSKDSKKGRRNSKRSSSPQQVKPVKKEKKDPPKTTGETKEHPKPPPTTSSETASTKKSKYTFIKGYVLFLIALLHGLSGILYRSIIYVLQHFSIPLLTTATIDWVLMGAVPALTHMLIGLTVKTLVWIPPPDIKAGLPDGFNPWKNSYVVTGVCNFFLGLYWTVVYWLNFINGHSFGIFKSLEPNHKYAKYLFRTHPNGHLINELLPDKFNAYYSNTMYFPVAVFCISLVSMMQKRVHMWWYFIAFAFFCFYGHMHRDLKLVPVGTDSWTTDIYMDEIYKPEVCVVSHHNYFQWVFHALVGCEI